jgi:hypothetical protein
MTAKHHRFRPLALLALSLACASPQAFAGDWNWLVAPYLWGAGLNTDLETKLPPPGTGSSTEFPDLIDKLDGAFQIHVEGQGDRWGMFTDYTYLGLAADEQRPLFDTASDLDVRLFELAAVWSPGEEKFEGLDVFAGLRRVDADFNMDITPVNPLIAATRIKSDASFNDFMLGARYTIPLSERWKLTLRGDGSWGDTDGTWNGSAVLGYATKRGAWGLGYRVLSGDFNNDDAKLNIRMSGFEVGYAFRF